MGMFTIQKTTTGNFYHIFNNESTKVNLSDFEVVLDDADATFIIQCKNGANIPYKPQSITELQVINLNIGTSPIPFSGVDGLRELLTSMNYTPYINGGGGGGGESLAETLAIDNKTNQIPIASNDGTSTIQVDNDGNLYLQSNFGGLKQILITEDEFTFQSSVRYDLNGKGVLINTNSDGFGLPRLTTTQMNAIVSPTNGMIVWNTTETATYQYNGAVWVLLGGGAVDSVNGQTGVVVLDATDVGAEPTKGSEDNYVTNAQLVVIGNTSGINSGDQDLTGLVVKANNLSDLTNINTARTNLGLGSLATQSGTFSGTSSGTNSGDNATNTKYEVTATTGAVISFATRQVYNSIASPSSSNLTDNLTGAQIGIVQKIYHNAGTAPTVPAGWVKRGTGNYVTSTLNIIYAEWSVGTTVEYWITQ